MLKWQGSKSGAILAAAGFAVALYATSVVPAKAGPFSWLTGKNKQQEQQQQPQQPRGNPGFLPFFGGGRGQQPWQGGGGPDPTTAPRADELPRDDPEALLITNPALGSAHACHAQHRGDQGRHRAIPDDRGPGRLADSPGKSDEARPARAGDRNLAAAA